MGPFDWIFLDGNARCRGTCLLLDERSKRYSRERTDPETSFFYTLFAHPYIERTPTPGAVSNTPIDQLIVHPLICRFDSPLCLL